MTSKRDLVAFKERFEEVNCLIKKDRRLTSLELRWGASKFSLSTG